MPYRLRNRRVLRTMAPKAVLEKEVKVLVKGVGEESLIPGVACSQ